MKKRLCLCFLIIICFISNVYAYTDESGQTIGSPSSGCPSTNTGHFYRNGSVGGVRFTFIDEKGYAITQLQKSFDFLTLNKDDNPYSPGNPKWKTPYYSSSPVYYNGGTGSRSKIDIIKGSSNSIKITNKVGYLKTLPLFEDLYKTYIKELDTLNKQLNKSYKACNYNTNAQGHAIKDDGFSSENSFIACLTSTATHGRKDVGAITHMKAFTMALLLNNNYSRANAEKIIENIYEKECQKNGIFLEADALVLGGKTCQLGEKYFFGTAADIAKSDSYIDIAANLAQDSATGFFYDEEIIDVEHAIELGISGSINNNLEKIKLFNGWNVVSKESALSKTTKASLNTKQGIGSRINWIGLDPTQCSPTSCSNCSYQKNGNTGKIVCKTETSETTFASTGDNYKRFSTYVLDNIKSSIKTYEQTHSVSLGYKDAQYYPYYMFTQPKNSSNSYGCCADWKKYYKGTNGAQVFDSTWNKVYEDICIEAPTCECVYKNGKIDCTGKTSLQVPGIYSESSSNLSLPSADLVKVDKLISTYPNKWSGTTENDKYAIFMFKYAKNANGKATGCCNAWSSQYKNFNARWKSIYDKICNKTTECSTCTFKGNGGAGGSLVCTPANGSQTIYAGPNSTDKNAIKIPDGLSTNNKNLLNETLKKYEPLIPNKMAIFAFAPVENGGKNCCPKATSVGIDNFTTNANWKKAYETFCTEPDPIEPYNPISPPLTEDSPTCSLTEINDNNKYNKINVNSCCSTDTKSEIKEIKLNEAFCYDDSLKVHYFKPRPGFETSLKNSVDTINNYCSLYCTESVSVEIPGTITAISGRYFTLNKINGKNNRQISSPYITGKRTCKNVIRYDKWLADYESQVDNQVSSYNTFQENIAYKEMFDDAIANKKRNQGAGKGEYRCTCTTTWEEKHIRTRYEETTYPASVVSGKKVCLFGGNLNKKTGMCSVKQAVPETYSESKNRTSSVTISCSIPHYVFTLEPSKFPYSTVKIDSQARKSYQANSFTGAGVKNPTPSKTQLIDDIDYSSCNSARSAQESKTEKPPSGSNIANGKGCSYSCTQTSTITSDNVYSKRDNYALKANSANDSFNAAAISAKNLENQIDQCDKYFTNYDGKNNPKKHYSLNTTIKFHYNQKYVVNLGYSKFETSDEETEIAFLNDVNNCVVQGPYLFGSSMDSTNDLRSNQYSQIYGSGKEMQQDFSTQTLTRDKGYYSFQYRLDTTYEADKKFTTDVLYTSECDWNEMDNTIYTLVPTGETSKDYSKAVSYNYSIHKREYKTYLSTLQGTYETRWDIKGLGHKGHFDEYFEKLGTNTCSNQKPSLSEGKLFTCEFKVINQLTSAGGCETTNGTITENCHANTDGYTFFNFKIVDEKNLFPNNTANYAYNWVNTNEGKEALKEIETRAKQDKTFAPENLTYSFVLTPNDITYIKEYNRERENKGGYNDFDFSCVCANGLCKQCKSNFLTNIADNNKINISAVSTPTVSIWNRKDKSITEIRNENANKGRW